MDTCRQLCGQYTGLGRDDISKGYSALITAGFIEAVERRSGGGYADAGIIAFVASVRARSGRLAADLDPDVAEQVIRVLLEDDASAGDLERSAVTGAQLVLLAGLITDAQLSDAGLDEFLAEARKLAGQLMG